MKGLIELIVRLCEEVSDQLSVIDDEASSVFGQFGAMSVQSLSSTKIPPNSLISHYKLSEIIEAGNCR